ncbi:hypothetical protein AB0J81_12470 [Streptomyces bobili]|uniref:hypothetical protein n=1 Tax=Streptomyces bobili TaxID=67280 RepID=UPI0034366588
MAWRSARCAWGDSEGYQVLAGYLTNRLYVTADPGTGALCRDVPGVRADVDGLAGPGPGLPRGYGAAHRVSPAKGSRLVDTGRPAGALLRMVDVGQPVAW